MFFRVRIRGVGGNDVTDPAERAAGPDPKPRCENQPENSRQNAPVVKLPDAGNDETQNACEHWIAHVFEASAQKYTLAFVRLFAVCEEVVGAAHLATVHPRRPLRFKSRDNILMFQSETDIVKSFEQAVSLKFSDVE